MQRDWHWGKGMAAQADERTERLPGEAAGIVGAHAQLPSGRFSTASLLIGVLSLILAAAFILIGPTGLARTVALLLLSCLAAAMTLVVRRMTNLAAAPAADPIQTLRPGHSGTAMPGLALLDSAGVAMLAIGLDGALLYANPAAERLLGYEPGQLKIEWDLSDILAPGEGARLAREMQRLCLTDVPAADSGSVPLMTTYMECLNALPGGMVPSFEARLVRRDGQLLQVMLGISALRDRAGDFCGLMAVAIDQTDALRQERELRESQERYRDLFENSSEMIATLSPAGRFLYANPAWKRCFDLENDALLALERFEDLFGPRCRTQASALFHRALAGETVERAPLRHHTPDGRMIELELSLSRRPRVGEPLSVRCLLHDVTRQKQREHRLALQLVVGQIVGENASADVTAARVLEALCLSQGWDLGLAWLVNARQNHLEFLAAWGAPGQSAERLIEESKRLTLPSGADLPGRAWKEIRTLWIADLGAMPPSPRLDAARRHRMVSGWAVPVRVGSQVLAVLEFYSNVKLSENSETIAAVEATAASLGQMLARTQEKGRAEELSRQQQVLLDSVADGICGVDRWGRVSFANPAAARMLGASATRLTGKPVHELLHGAAADGHRCGEGCALRRAAQHRHPISGEDTIFRADGSGFPAEYTLTPILDHGRFSGSVLSFRDISQRSALDRMKDEFISTVSHELRTPLTSIRGALGLLSAGALGSLDDKAANLMRIALTNCDRLVRLINDILDLERIQSGREPLAFRPVQIADIIRQAIEGMQPVADSAGVHLIHDSGQAQISADPDRLLQVFTNLLSNAIKFSPPNSTVSIMLRREADGVTLSVIDHGRGIPADKLESIFGRFQQVDASDSRQKGGSGLGLAICRTIVMQHSGRIWAERNPVRGSTFRVYLPYDPESPGSAADASERAINAS